MLFVGRHARSPIPGIPLLNLNIKATVSALSPVPTDAELVNLVLLIFAPPATAVHRARENDIILWLIRLTAWATGRVVDVKSVKDMGVHTEYFLRFVKGCVQGFCSNLILFSSYRNTACACRSR